MDGSNFYFEIDRKSEPYLKCRYEKGVFPIEYLINFTTINSTARENPLLINDGSNLVIRSGGFENYMFVYRRDVIILECNKGLVKLLEILNGDEEKSLVGIKDVGDCRISKRYVPTDEIKWV